MDKKRASTPTSASANIVRGDLGAFSIFDVTQSLMVGRKTAEVILLSGQRKGYLHFQDGQIVAAVDDRLATGESAAMNIFAWQGGSFTIEIGRLPDRHNVEIPTDQLLLEVARNIDEIRRDNSTTEEPTECDESEAVTDRVGDRLRQELNRAFRRVAQNAEPNRARYTRQAFDGALTELMKSQGTVLFLRAGHQARIKTRSGFVIVEGKPIDREEIEGFLALVLSGSEQHRLREEKEVGTYFHSGVAGRFRITAAHEQGVPLLAFTPVSQGQKGLESYFPGDAALKAIREITEGLILVSGPIGSGKGDLVEALVSDHMGRRGAFAVLFGSGNPRSLTPHQGFCIQRELPPPGVGFSASIRSALEQGPDVLAFIGANHLDALSTAVGAATNNRLLIFTAESQSPAHTLTLLSRVARAPDGDLLLDALADRLRLIIDVIPSHGSQLAGVDVMSLDRDLQGLLRSGDLDALRRARLSGARLGS